MCGPGSDSGGLSRAICFRFCNKKGMSKIYYVKIVEGDYDFRFYELPDLFTGRQSSWTVQDSVIYVTCSKGSFCLDFNRPKSWCPCPSMIVSRKGALIASLNGRIFVMGGESGGGDGDEDDIGKSNGCHQICCKNIDDEVVVAYDDDSSDPDVPHPWAEFFDPISHAWIPHSMSPPMEGCDHRLTFSAVDPAGRYFLVGNVGIFKVFDGYAKNWQFFGRYDSYIPLRGSGLFIDNTIILLCKDVLQSYHIHRREYSDARIMGLQALGFSDSRGKPSLIHLEGSIFDSTAGALFCLVWSDLHSPDFHSPNCLHVQCTTFRAIMRQLHNSPLLEAIVESSKPFMIEPDPNYSKDCYFEGALVVALPKAKIAEKSHKRLFSSILQTPPFSPNICFRLYNEKDDMSRFYHVNLHEKDEAGIAKRPTYGILPKWELKTGRESSWVMHESVLYVLGGYSSSSNSSEAFQHKHVFCIDTSEHGGRWSECPSMIARRSRAMAAFLKGELFVMGGVRYNSNQTFDQLPPKTTIQAKPILGTDAECWAECFNPNTRKWSSLPLPPPPFTSSFIASDATEKIILGDFGVLQVIEGCDKLEEADNFPSDFPFQGRGLFMDGQLLFVYKDALCNYDLMYRDFCISRIVGFESRLGYQWRNQDDLPSLIHLSGSITEPAGACFCLVWSDRRPCGYHPSPHPSNHCLHVHCTKFHAVQYHDHRNKLSLEASVQTSQSFVIECCRDPDSTISCHFEGALLLQG